MYMYFVCFKMLDPPQPRGIKGENISFLPSLSPAVKSFTTYIGVYTAQ